MDIIHEITPLSEKDCFYIVDRRKTRNFTYPIHCHLEYELNFIEHAPGRRVVGDSGSDRRIRVSIDNREELGHVWEQNACKSPLIHEITIQFLPISSGIIYWRKTNSTVSGNVGETARHQFPMSSILKVYHLLGKKLVSGGSKVFMRSSTS